MTTIIMIQLPPSTRMRQEYEAWTKEDAELPQSIKSGSMRRKNLPTETA